MAEESEAEVEVANGRNPADEEFLRSVIDNLPVGVFCKDVGDDFRIRLWNKKNVEITGFGLGEALGKTDGELFPAWQAKQFRDDDQAVIDGGKELDIDEEEVDSLSLGRIFLRTKKVPIRDSAGRVYLLGICEDVTERKQTREALVRAMEELKATQLQLIQAEKLESIGRLAAGVAHEVKNPLALLLLGVEYLSGGIDPGDANIPVVLAEMREAIHRADKILRGMVDFSSTGQLDLKPLRVNDLVGQAMMMMRHEFTKNNVDVVVDLEEGMGPLKLDETKMGQVLINLMMNAVHAMQGMPRRVLRVQAESGVLKEAVPEPGSRASDQLRVGDRIVRIKISDSGKGIRPEQLGKIFDPFFTTKETGVGTGLGLTVVRKIVELHRGLIGVENRPGGGVVVTVTLPAEDPS